MLSPSSPPTFDVKQVSTYRPPFNPEPFGVAALSESDQFKLSHPTPSTSSEYQQPPSAKSWINRLSHETLSRPTSSLKGEASHICRPDVLSLGGGLPSCENFPMYSVKFEVPSLESISNASFNSPLTPPPTSATQTFSIGKFDQRSNPQTYDLATALNYGQGSGSGQMIRLVTEHTQLVHNPLYRDWACTMTVGNTYGLELVLRMFGTPGHAALCAEYAFASAIETGKAMNIRFHGVTMDHLGICPGALTSLLETWDPIKQKSPRPTLMYLVPTGQNPTGCTMSLERRKAIYAIAQQYDLLIIEDDPYYFLQFPPYESSQPDPLTHPIYPSYREYVKSLTPSLLALDIDGRVIRLDSFSKVIMPGIRVGWITAPKLVIEHIQKHCDISTQGPSGLSQLFLYKLIEETWGHAGYLDWLRYASSIYMKRRAILIKACEKYLPLEVVSWKPTMAGMFQWLKVDHTKHPDFQSGRKTLRELETEIFNAALERNVLVIKGTYFYANPDSPPNKLFFRVTYATGTESEIDEAVRRFGLALRDVFGLHPTPSSDV